MTTFTAFDEQAGQLIHQRDLQWAAIAWEHLHQAQRVAYIETGRLVVELVSSHAVALRRALQAATQALRSYQHGNGAPDLAEEIADFADQVLASSIDGG